MQPHNMFLNYEQRLDVKINVVKSIKRQIRSRESKQHYGKKEYEKKEKKISPKITKSTKYIKHVCTKI